MPLSVTITDLHFLPAQQSTSIPLSLESCIMRLTGDESAAATQMMRDADAILPEPIGKDEGREI